MRHSSQMSMYRCLQCLSPAKELAYPILWNKKKKQRVGRKPKACFLFLSKGVGVSLARVDLKVNNE